MLNGGYNGTIEDPNSPSSPINPYELKHNEHTNNLLNIKEQSHINNKIDTNGNEHDKPKRPQSSTKRPEKHGKSQSESPNNTKYNKEKNSERKYSQHSYEKLNTNDLEVDPNIKTENFTKLEFTEEELNDFTYVLIKNLEATKIEPKEIIKVCCYLKYIENNE